jgi:hypothetical protein
MSGTHLGPVTNLSFSLKFSFDSCRFVILLRPLWREDGSVIYCTIASGLCQSSHSWVEVPQNSRPYFIVSFETPPTWRARSPYVYPPGTGWPIYTPGHWVPFLSPLTTLRATVEGSFTVLLIIPLHEPHRKHRSQSYIAVDGQSASLSWCQASVWGSWPDFYDCQRQLRVSRCGTPSLTRGRVCSLQLRLLLASEKTRFLCCSLIVA